MNCHLLRRHKTGDWDASEGGSGGFEEIRLSERMWFLQSCLRGWTGEACRPPGWDGRDSRDQVCGPAAGQASTRSHIGHGQGTGSKIKEVMEPGGEEWPLEASGEAVERSWAEEQWDLVFVFLRGLTLVTLRTVWAWRGSRGPGRRLPSSGNPGRNGGGLHRALSVEMGKGGQIWGI